MRGYERSVRGPLNPAAEKVLLTEDDHSGVWNHSERQIIHLRLNHTNKTPWMAQWFYWKLEHQCNAHECLKSTSWKGPQLPNLPYTSRNYRHSSDVFLNCCARANLLDFDAEKLYRELAGHASTQIVHSKLNLCHNLFNFEAILLYNKIIEQA